MNWRSREKWVGTATIASWAHKHPYPRSLNLKAVLPQSQTLRIPPESSARVAFAIPRQRATVRPLPNRRFPISAPRLGEDQHRQRSERHCLDPCREFFRTHRTDAAAAEPLSGLIVRSLKWQLHAQRNP
jgi:hypothetical protein